MTALRIAGLATAGFLLASAGAFAQTQAPAPQPAAPTVHTQTLTHSQKVALEKSCKSDWAAEKKAGQTANLHYKTFIADCMKKGV